MVLDFFCPICVAQHNNVMIHACCPKWQHFICSMAEEYAIVYTYHIFFIQSSIEGQFGCFRFLATINDAAMIESV